MLLQQLRWGGGCGSPTGRIARSVCLGVERENDDDNEEGEEEEEEEEEQEENSWRKTRRGGGSINEMQCVSRRGREGEGEVKRLFLKSPRGEVRSRDRRDEEQGDGYGGGGVVEVEVEVVEEVPELDCWGKCSRARPPSSM